jgi:2-methylcitrate dehydratase PrpD
VTHDRGPTRELAEFTSSLRFDDIPREVGAAALVAIRDVIGCGIYGATRPWSRIVQDQMPRVQGPGSSRVWGTSFRTSPTSAALANGTAAHAAEMDDLHKASFYHPSAATVPAAFAVADLSGSATGRDLITAVVAGYEVGARVGMGLGQGHFLRGYHPQGSVGIFAAAATAARMLQLDAGATVHALGIAGTQASGLMAAQEGAMVKRLHAGLACESGVRGARLASAGFTGIEDVLEADFGGLLSTLGTADSDPSLLTIGLGTRWQTLDIEYKRHAACAAIHSSLDIVESIAPAASDVDEVTVWATTHSYLHCGFDYQPNGVTAAQMSFQYCLAAMILFGQVGVDQFTDELIADPRILALAARIRVIPDPELDLGGPANRHAVRVEIRTRSGEVLRGERTQRRGSAGEPLSVDELGSKFRGLAAHGAERVDELSELILGLDGLDDLDSLSRWLAEGS